MTGTGRAAAITAALTLLLGAPAAASACPSLSKIKSYSGTSSLAYSGRATGSDGGGGTATVSIDHRASDVTLSSMTPDKADQDFTGTATGGSLTVNDSYSDPSNMTAGAQTANGPDQHFASASISFTPSNCTYTVTVDATIPTTTTGNGPHDAGTSDSATSPQMKIPANLKLSGSVTIDAYSTGPVTIAQIEAGEYILGGPLSSWSLALSSAKGVNGEQPLGPATFSWSISPSFKKGKQSKKKCVVPSLKGKKLAAAKTALHKANCRVGKIQNKRSSSVGKGRVISSRPAAGKKLKAGAKVALSVSSGKKPKPKPKPKPKLCTVPKLAGKTLAAAKKALRQARCSVGKVTRKKSSQVPKGRVISSQPQAGTKHKRGAKVALKLSTG